MTRESTEFLVIGAGVAGLAAAATLRAAGAEVVLLEARDAAGGRIRTVRPPETGVDPLECGAEFLPADGEAARLLSAHGMPLAPVTVSHARLHGGRLERQDLEAVLERGMKILPASDDNAPDTTLARALSHAVARKEIETEVADAVRRYIENYHAAPADEVSAHWVAAVEATDEGGGGGRQVRSTEGLDCLVRILTGAVRPGAIRFRRHVLGIDLPDTAGGVGGNSRIRVRARGLEGEGEWEAEGVVVALPISVLRSGRPLITGLPGTHAKALSGLRMGHVVKLPLRFRRPFWRELVLAGESDWSELTFLHSDGAFPTWWTAEPESALVAWAGGPAAARLREEATNGGAREALVQRAVAQLAGMLACTEEALRDELVTSAWHDWSGDPLFAGAYPYAQAGSARASQILREPVGSRLVLAGDATTEEMGTVEGALKSGRAAALTLLESAGSSA